MRDFLTKISSLAFGLALLGGVITKPELFVVWGVRVGIGSLLAALGWEVAANLRQEK